HERHEEIAERRGYRRDEEKPHHDHPVHREEPVVGVGRDETRPRHGELNAHQRGRGAAQEKEERDRDRVEDGDPLVVVRGEPRGERVALAEVAFRHERRGGCGAHAPPFRVFRYAMRSRMSASSSCPWNDGITGAKPATTSLRGSNIESRIYASS